MARTAHPYAPDPRARVIWLFAIVVAGLAAWFLDAEAGRLPPAADPVAAEPPGAEEVDVVWFPEAEPPQEPEGAAAALDAPAAPAAPTAPE